MLFTNFRAKSRGGFVSKARTLLAFAFTAILLASIPGESTEYTGSPEEATVVHSQLSAHVDGGFLYSRWLDGYNDVVGNCPSGFCPASIAGGNETRTYGSFVISETFGVAAERAEKSLKQALKSLAAESTASALKRRTLDYVSVGVHV